MNITTILTDEFIQCILIENKYGKIYCEIILN